MSLKLRDNYILSYSAIVVFLIMDRWLKYFFMQNPDIKQDFVFVTFRLVKNYGIAFGLSIYFPLIIIVTIFALFFLCFLFTQPSVKKNMMTFFCLSIIIVGAISNFCDRIIYGNVVDYIDIPFFTVINIADIFITMGVVIIFINEFLFNKNK